MNQSAIVKSKEAYCVNGGVYISCAMCVCHVVYILLGNIV